MAIDIIHEIKNHLGNAPVPKIDPNTQEPVKEEKGFLNNVESAAIPVVLLGFYKNTRNEDDANNIMKQDDAATLKTLFKEHTDQVIKTVSNHSNADEGEAKTAMEKTIAAIKKIVRDNVKDLNGFNIMAFFTNQRTNILKHLPTELHAGELLNDPAMDDRTNKMEGPMSGMMHGIEKIFSSNK
jgi:hypothetical protein